VRVGPRAPLGVVHAIDDAAQLPAVLAQDPVQAPTAFLCLALPCIPAGVNQEPSDEVFVCRAQLRALVQKRIGCPDRDFLLAIVQRQAKIQT
jgi:hypothetical protein